MPSRRSILSTAGGLALAASASVDALALVAGRRAVLLDGGSRNPIFGVNMSGAEFAPWNGQTFPIAADWRYLASKGVSFVRLPIAWESIQPTLSAALNATYLASLKAAIASANTVGIKIIVDIHNFAHYAAQAQWITTIPYAGNAGTDAANVSNLGDATLTSAAFVDLWTRLATALIGTPGVIGYELMNEPVGIVGTNLATTPNFFSGANWNTTNGGVLTQLTAGSNPLGAAYGPAWNLTSGTGFGGVAFNFTFANVPYTWSCYAKCLSGTETGNLQFVSGSNQDFTVTTSWQRFSFTNTPSAGVSTCVIFVNTASAGHSIQIANAQLELGSSATAYQPSTWQPFAQSAIAAIRAIDANTPIYVDGLAFGLASVWIANNFEMTSLTGSNLIFAPHQYFDGTQGVGGGGVYSGTYTSYGIDNNSGTQALASFLSWLSSQGKRGFLGEFGVPNSVADNNPQWLILQQNVLRGLAAAGVRVPATMWFYGNNGLLAGGVLNVAPVGGVDDPRLIQMLAIK